MSVFNILTTRVESQLLFQVTLLFNRVKIIIFTSPNDAQVTRGEAVIAGHLPPVGSRLPDLAEIELRG